VGCGRIDWIDVAQDRWHLAFKSTTISNCH
jgi:hypothetical protein